MESVKMFIVEDNVIVAENLAMKLEQLGFEILGIFDSGESVLEQIKTQVPDIVLMDIYLSGDLDGIQTAQKISEEHDIPFIYLSDHYDKSTVSRAMQTFPANYLIKPFNEHELNVAIQLAFHNASYDKHKEPEEEEEKEEAQYVMNNSIFIKENSRYQKIAIEDIIRVEADRAYSKIHTTQKTITFTGSLNVIARQLDDPAFVRVHRSHFVNMTKITAYEGNMIYIDEVQIPVSKQYQKEFFSRFRVMR